MCRNIRVLHNYAPPATEEEIRAAALQYVRKVGGGAKPAKDNVAAYEWAVEEVARVTEELLARLVPHGPAKNREEEAVKAKERWKKREARIQNG